ncbi:class I SAM-dependent methyltransferase [Nocardia farcinica]|nr:MULTISPECIES: class I SAM-dependent methyltransferase [Nocardia]MBF6069667.1 class I SAM-dependent methyltransferase [Nocardia farcinica]MBF6139173.1 class I SAM-dependent methyltransferase [Nocardia farcinica]MBF6232886.1 class I SAM-dependent methyltransferase [Nocardia farcinica]MBF6248695.1 class I SAM-dependent methyltransferase [Nocardia elegans]MBF6249054.1 class I SAM-dependent methyltransferase [Nocardia farcinica]
MPVPLHTTGKASFDDIYDRPDPRAYYTRMSALDYRIPELAKPFFEQQIREYRASARTDTPTVLDIGCSYGVNAALLRFDTTIADLAAHYAGAGDLDPAALAARDRARLTEYDAWPGVRFLGVDASRPALDYAAAAGLLHEVVHADLEAADPTDDQRALLARADLVVSTGCIGYVTEKTLVRIATAHPRRRPWMAHFVLRMFDFGPIAAELDALGYRTEQVPGLFRQRRFAAPAERDHVLATLADHGIDTRGHESEGWLYASLFVSRPDPAARA